MLGGKPGYKIPLIVDDWGTVWFIGEKEVNRIIERENRPAKKLFAPWFYTLDHKRVGLIYFFLGI